MWVICIPTGRGAPPFALDLMEELRPLLGDRFCLTLVNSRIIRPEHFEPQESGAVFLNDAGRKAVLAAWQEKKTGHPHSPLSWRKGAVGACAVSAGPSSGAASAG